MNNPLNNPLSETIVTPVPGPVMPITITIDCGCTTATDGSSHNSFITLTDTPQSYLGQAGKIPIVNNTESGLIFGTIPIPEVLTFNNGITKTSGTIQLGGNSLIHDTSINTLDRTFLLGDLTNNKTLVGISSATSEILIQTKDSLNNRSILTLASSDNSGEVQNGISLYRNNSTGTGFQILAFDIPIETGPSGFMMVGDTINNKGLENAGDYESNFTDKSLITKQFFDTGVSGFITGGNNGITPNGTILQLGGALAHLTTINLNNNYLLISDTNFGVEMSHINGFSIYYRDGSTFSSELAAYSTLAHIRYQTQPDGTYETFAAGSAYGLLITDETRSRGAIYNGDYEPNFIPRSLVTKQYVDGLVVTSDNGLTKTSNNIQWGGSLVQNVDIDQRDFKIEFKGTNVDQGIDFFLDDTAGGSSIVISTNTNNTTYGLASINLQSGGGVDSHMVLNVRSDTDISKTLEIFLSNQGSGVTITDTIDNFGMSYSDDYSAIGMTSDRWIPDWGTTKNYVSTAVSAGATPIGTASGDLSGIYPSPVVNTINSITKNYYDPTSSIQTQLNGKQASLGFTPVTNARTLTINGTTFDLTADRSWIIAAGSGTVTSVSSANADIAVSVSSPNPILTLNSGAGANQIVKRDSSGNLNATTVTTNANLIGDITSVGNTTTASGALVKTVILNTPNIFTNPVTYTTTTGTATGALSLVTQSQNRFFAGPISGSAANPIFRAIDPTDIPTLNQNTTGNAATVTTNANLTGDITSVGNATTASSSIVKSVVLNTTGVLYSNPVTYATSGGVATGSLVLVSQVANTVLAGPSTGSSTTPTFRTLVTADVPTLTAISNGNIAFGDSITYGTGATSLQTGFSYLFGRSIGGPYINYGNSGDQAADMAYRWVFPNSNPQGSGIDPVYTHEIGTNDVTYYTTTTNLQNVFNRTILATMSWLAIPKTSKTFAQAGTLTGFTADNNIQNLLGATSTTNGNTLSMTLTTNASSQIYIWYLIKDGNTGTFTAKLDGTLQADPYTSSTTINAFGDGGTALATHNGVTSSIVCLRIPVSSAGSHTVLITNNGTTGQTVTIYGIGTNPTTSTNNPYVVVFTPNHQNNANDTLSGTYSGFVTTQANLLITDGLNVKIADSRTALGTNYGTLYADAIHPNNAGHLIESNTGLATLPAALLIGNTLPNVYQACQNIIPTAPLNMSQWFTPNGGNLVSASAINPGILLARANGNNYGINYQANTGITNSFPNTGGTVAWSVGPYTNASGLPSALPPLVASQYITVQSNGLVTFFPNSSNIGTTLKVQSGSVIAGPVSSQVTGASFSSFFNNNYFQTQFIATSGTNQSSNIAYWRASIWHAGAATVDDLGFINIVSGGGADPNTTLTLTHSNGGSGLFGFDISASTKDNKLGASTATTMKVTAAPTYSSGGYNLAVINIVTGNIETVTISSPTIQASANLIAQTAAGNITTFTVGAATATFNISAYINITAVATDVIQAQITYTDENNTAQTVSFTTLSTVTNSTYSPVTIRAKNGTIITLKTNLTTGIGSITFDAGGTIIQN